MAESPFDDDIEDMKVLAKAPSLQELQRQATIHDRWEENALKRILTLGGKGQIAKQLIQQHHANTNEYKLTFADFRRECPEFPIHLDFEKLKYSDLERLAANLGNMRRVDKNRVIKTYLDHRQMYADHRFGSFGLVFEWLHHGSPYKILHNYFASNLPTYPWTKTIIALSDTETLFLEDLDSFLEAIKWTKKE